MLQSFSQLQGNLENQLLTCVSVLSTNLPQRFFRVEFDVSG